MTELLYLSFVRCEIIQAQSLTISGNDCKVHGAAIFADETCSSATTEDILYGIGFTEQRPTETCPVVFPTDPEAKEKAILVKRLQLSYACHIESVFIYSLENFRDCTLTCLRIGNLSIFLALLTVIHCAQNIDTK